MSQLNALDLAPDHIEATTPRLSWIALGLLVCYFLKLYVGFSPFPGHEEMSTVAVVEAASGSIRNQLIEVLFAIVGLLLLCMNGQKTVRLITQLWPVWVLLMFCAASIVWSPVPELAARRLARLLLDVVTIAGIVVGVSSTRTFVRTTALVIGAVMVVNVVSVFALPGLARNEFGQFIGMYGHKNHAGLRAMLAIFVFLAAAQWTTSKLERYSLLLGAGVWLFFLLGTYSKTAITLTIVAPLLVLALLYAANHKQVAVLLTLVISFVVGVLLYLLLLWNLSILELLTVLVWDDATLTGRTFLWEFLLEEIHKRPALGIGFGSFWATGESSPALRYGTDFAQRIVQGHNGYLDVSVTLGLIGLGLLVAFLVYVSAIGLRNVSNRQMQDFSTAFNFFYFVILFSAIIYNITETSFLRTGSILWTVLLFVVFLALSDRAAPAEGGLEDS